MESNEFLVTCSQSSQQFSACLWNYNTLNVQKYYKNGGIVTSKCLAFIDQDYLLGAELGKPLLHVWPLNSQDIAKNLRLILPEPATCLAVCPKNVYLAVGIGCKIYVWQISSGKLLSIQQKNYQPITCVKFSSEGEFLLLGGQDGILICYNLAEMVTVTTNFLTQTDIGQVEPVYVKNDHSMPIKDMHVGCFGRKSRFATVSSDQTCRLYNLLTGQALLALVFSESLTAVIFDAPCWQLFVGTETGSIKQFNLKNPPRTTTHHIDDETSLTFNGHTKKIVCLALNISNTIVASGSADNFVYTWEIKSRQILKKIEHTGAVTNIKFVMNYKNFFIENLKPQVVLKNLERNTDSNNDFTVAIVQTDDIDLSDDENSLKKEKIRQNLDEDNKKLRIANKELYAAALEICQKYNKTMN